MQLLLKGVMAACLLGAGFGLASFTQDDKKPAQDAMGGMGAKAGPEHQWLAEGAGTFKASVKFTDESGASHTMEGVQTNTMMPGGLWQVIEFKANDGSFHGHGIAGYDPHKKKYVSVWTDSWTSTMSLSEGTLDAAKKALTSEMSTVDPTGKPTKMTEVLTRKDKDNVRMELKMPMGEQTVTVMTIDYVRQK
jgi:hypothetical protein